MATKKKTVKKDENIENCDSSCCSSCQCGCQQHFHILKNLNIISIIGLLITTILYVSCINGYLCSNNYNPSASVSQYFTQYLISLGVLMVLCSAFFFSHALIHSIRKCFAGKTILGLALSLVTLLTSITLIISPSISSDANIYLLSFTSLLLAIIQLAIVIFYTLKVIKKIMFKHPSSCGCDSSCQCGCQEGKACTCK